MTATIALRRAISLIRTLQAACRALSSLSAPHASPGRMAAVLGDMVTTRSAAQSRGSPAVSLAQAVANLQAAYGTTSAGEPAAVSSQHAAVLVPLFFSPEAGEVHVVLTQRSGKLNTHAGEVCFPGGKREAGDADDAATALREAHEELGIDPAAVAVVASLPPVLSKHLLSVRPVVGTVSAGLRVSPNPDEVAHVFTAPLRMFLEAGPGYSHRDVRWEGCPYRLHYFGY